MPFQELFIWSIVISIIYALLYRFLSKPKEMREIKEKMKENKEKLKRAQKEGRKEETSQLYSESMSLTKKQFEMTKKPMFASFALFFIVVLGFLSPVFGPYAEVEVQETSIGSIGLVNEGTFYFNDAEFSVIIYDENQKVRMDLNGNGNFNDEKEFTRDDLIFEEDGYYWRYIGEHQGRWPFEAPKEDVFLFTPDMLELPFQLPLPTWEMEGVPFVFLATHFNWFWWYVLITLPFIQIFRKLLGVE